MRIHKILSLFLISIIQISVCLAQENNESATYLSARYHKGFIWAHTSALKEISNTFPFGIQLDFSKVYTSKKAWDSCNCYSKTGISFTYFNYGYQEVLGNSYSLIAFAEPFLTLGNKMYITTRAGIGVTFLDQVYDEQTNPKNLYYSSPISFIVLANISANYALNQNWILNLSGNYSHISNGGMKKPNKGMNFPTASIGAEYVINPVKLVRQEKKEKEKGKINITTRIFATMPDVPPTDNLPADRAWLFGTAVGVQTAFTNLNGISLGAEFIHDNSLKEEGIRKNIDADHHILGISAGHHLFFGRFDFNQQIGYYLYKPFPFTSHNFYQRYELIYQINKFLLAGLSLKTHLEVAENFDVRIGFIL